MNRKKIDDVIAEMREFVQACDTNELACPCDQRQVLMYKGMRLRDVAEKWADELAVLDVVKASVGNIVAMHDALCEIVLLTIKAGRLISCDVACGIIASEAKHALKQPPRNCDRHGGDYKKLHAEWFDWTGTPEGHNPDGTAKMAFGEWLLALAPEDRAEKGHA